MENLYLVGKGIAHSKSPAMYNALYAHLSLDWRYELADLESNDLARDFFASDAWLSLNVTTPYKPLATSAADVLAASVQLTGGANMLFGLEGKTVALNTDGVGCVRHIQREGFAFGGARVVVCGTGPTSLAIFAASAQAGASRVALIGRDRDKAKRVLEAFMARYKKLAYATMDLKAARAGERSFRAAYEEPAYVFGSYSTSTNEIASADIIIDATPLGMNAGDPLPFAADLLGGQRLVYDVVYGHGSSKLLEAASRAHVDVLDGSGMVVGQAVENAFVLLDSQGVDIDLDWDGAFDLMEKAAASPS